MELHQLLNQYEEVCNTVSRQILSSGKTQKHFYLSLGLSRSTFERRMREGGWTLRELYLLGQEFPEVELAVGEKRCGVCPGRWLERRGR